MLNFIPLFLYIFTLYRISKYLKSFFSLSVYIWLLHGVSMFCFWVKADIFSGFENDYTLYALLVMYITLLLITLPLVQFEKKLIHVSMVSDIPISKLHKTSKILIILSIYSIVFFAINLPKVFAANIVDLRNERIVFYSSSIFSKIACLGAFSSIYCIYLYFYYKIKQIEPKIQKMLLISSTSFIFYTLNVAGRDGFVIWSFSYVAGIFLFYRFLPKHEVRKIFKSFIVLILLIVPVFMFITSTRFGSGGNKYDAIESVFAYAGQALPNLSYEIDLTDRLNRRQGEGHCPIALVNTIVGDNEDRFDRMEELGEWGFRSNQFSSYVSFFYPAYQIYFLILFVIIFWIIVSSSTKIYCGKFDLSVFLPAFTWYMIPIVGIFYFYYSELIGNVFLLIPFFLRRYLK